MCEVLLVMTLKAVVCRMYHHVVWYKFADISEVPPIMKAEGGEHIGFL